MCLLPLSLSASFPGHNVPVHIFTVSRREHFCSQMLDASTKSDFPAFSLKFFIFNRRMIALQYCIGFCHISTWIGHRHMYIYFPSSLHNSLSFKSNTLTRMCLRLLHGSAFLVYSVSESLNSVLPSHWETLRLSHRWILFWSIVGSLTETIVLLHWTVFVFVPLVAQQLKRLPGMQETQVQSLSGRSPGEGNGTTL